MKSISTLLQNLRNLLPYLLLIAIYFFFVNLEASKDQKDSKNFEQVNLGTDDKNSYKNNELRITIPVIPYKK